MTRPLDRLRSRSGANPRKAFDGSGMLSARQCRALRPIPWPRAVADVTARGTTTTAICRRAGRAPRSSMVNSPVEMNERWLAPVDGLRHRDVLVSSAASTCSRSNTSSSENDHLVALDTQHSPPARGSPLDLGERVARHVGLLDRACRTQSRCRASIGAAHARRRPTRSGRGRCLRGRPMTCWAAFAASPSPSTMSRFGQRRSTQATGYQIGIAIYMIAASGGGRACSLGDPGVDRRGAAGTSPS